MSEEIGDSIEAREVGCGKERKEDEGKRGEEIPRGGITVYVGR
jgi:hypothetical protein